MSASTRERYFCSDTARVRQDDNAATATRVDVWILVELSATWGARPLLDAPMPPSVRATLTSAIAQIPRCRVVFIRRRFETRTGCRVYIARSAPKPWITSIDLPSIDDVAALPLRALARGEGRGQSAEGRSAGGAEGGALKAEGRAQRAERRGDPSELLPSALCPLPSDPSEPLPSAFRALPSPLPLVLVCTHGQRDSCCGRRGFPLYDALRHDESLDVWQCSHIGGDRFAANAVVLPWGLYYGPVEPGDAGALSESVRRGEILLDAYRGRSSMPRLGQAAETFVRRASGITARDAFQITARATLDDGRTHVHLRDAGGTLHEVTLEQFVSTPSALLTCTATATCPIVQFRMVDYRVTPG